MCGIMFKEPEYEVKPITKDDVPSISLDFTKTIKDFGWADKVPFGVWLERAIDWYDLHGVENIVTHLPQKQFK